MAGICAEMWEAWINLHVDNWNTPGRSDPVAWSWELMGV